MGERKKRVGIVVSDKMQNTVVVQGETIVQHPVYKKYIKRRKKYYADNQIGAKIGDKVRITETRPLSAMKRWRVVEVLK
ncbi:30S ribosomal protein S17 [bacterium]|nr:30S ribosomal protein S17 [bacterium]MBU1599807.1 30S ribosomal protein S17 [bacterium]